MQSFLPLAFIRGCFFRVRPGLCSRASMPVNAADACAEPVASGVVFCESMLQVNQLTKGFAGQVKRFIQAVAPVPQFCLVDQDRGTCRVGVHCPRCPAPGKLGMEEA